MVKDCRQRNGLNMKRINPLLFPFLLVVCFLLVSLGFFREAWYQYWYHTARLGMTRYD